MSKCELSDKYMKYLNMSFAGYADFRLEVYFAFEKL